MAMRAAWDVLTAPSQVYVAPPTEARLARYEYLAAWEQGTVFATGTGAALRPAVWAESLKSNLRLYRHTRLVWNPFPDLTDFWGSVVYPGVLTRDGTSTDQRPSAIPFSAAVQADKPELVAAAAQGWWWSNMQQLKYEIPYLAAIAANMLIEVVDDLPNQKVYLRPRWAGLVRDILLNPSGDVTYYALEYPVQPPVAGAQSYTYRLEVSQREYRTFKDGKPWDYEPETGRGAAWPNEWGFVPACWVPHQPAGADYGAPAIGPWLQELLEINSLQSMLDDDVARATQPITTFHTDGSVTPLYANGKRAATSELDPEDGDRESIRAFKLPKDSTVGKIEPGASIAEISAYIAQRKAEFYRHFPELSMWESLRQRDVSGVAAEILHGDTRNKVLTVRPATDRQVEKATQMLITMAAVRVARSWTIKDARRAVFAPFDAGSFARGDLDFEIDSRPLVPDVPLTDNEKADLAQKYKDLGLPLPFIFERMGVPDAVIQVATAGEVARQAAPAPQEAQGLQFAPGVIADLQQLSTTPGGQERVAAFLAAVLNGEVGRNGGGHVA